MEHSLRATLSASRLREVLHYEPETGEWTWQVNRGTAYRGMRVRSKNTHGYIHVKIDRVSHEVHRLAFLYMEGAYPALVDHRNRVRDDNRWSNLRPATYSINNANRTRKLDAAQVSA